MVFHSGEKQIVGVFLFFGSRPLETGPFQTWVKFLQPTSPPGVLRTHSRVALTWGHNLSGKCCTYCSLTLIPGCGMWRRGGRQGLPEAMSVSCTLGFLRVSCWLQFAFPYWELRLLGNRPLWPSPIKGNEVMLLLPCLFLLLLHLWTLQQRGVDFLSSSWSQLMILRDALSLGLLAVRTSTCHISFSKVSF